MKILVKSMFLLGALLSMAAQAKDVKPTKELQASIQRVISDPTVTISYFEGPEGLIGVGVTTISGERAVVFADKKGKYLFSGPTFDLQYQEKQDATAIAKPTLPLNARYMKHVPQPDSEKLLSTLNSASIVSIGSESPIEEYYVLADAKCGWCHKTWKGFNDLIAKGHQIRVHWIMVGVLTDTSKSIAKAVLGTDGNRADILAKAFDDKSFTPIAEDIKAGELAFAQNEKLWSQMGFTGVPDTFLKADDKVSLLGNVPNFTEIERRLESKRSKSTELSASGM